MLTQILILIAGLALIVLGAEWLVDGASSIARKARISEFVIGLTIVGFGTSCPELVVSLNGTLAGSGDISAGNVIGSNIFNTLLILGLTALISPIAITRDNKRRDVPMTLAVTLIFIVTGMSKSLFGLGEYDGISRVEGIVFLILFALYIFYCFKSGKADSGDGGDSRERSAALSLVLVAAGLAGLVFGGKLFVNSATWIARTIGVSDKFIAVTILAGGTSLPELATCIVAAAKKKGQLALGNILGSNIFNILLILGCSALVSPLHFGDINLLDAGVMLLSVILVMASAYTGKKDELDRMDGAIMLLCEAAYLATLFMNL